MPSITNSSQRGEPSKTPGPKSSRASSTPSLTVTAGSNKGVATGLPPSACP
ncbi:hypothetical protein [Wenzhouxiangella limi]|uniref:hypothetical protein n=1 Tax=Wenzhouxiangella limi TaxID=2707351 RepID=UPI001EF30FAE|nr:hypothetical protein [Wenzhouxiangella limi]